MSCRKSLSGPAPAKEAVDLGFTNKSVAELARLLVKLENEYLGAPW